MKRSHSYSLLLKKEILLLLSKDQLPCCHNSFLSGICRGRLRTFIKLRKTFKKALHRYLKTHCQQRIGKVRGSRLFLKETGLKEMRQKYVERVKRTSEAGSGKHCQIAFLQGLFVAKGYMQDPGSGYHFEFRLRGRWLSAAFKKTVRQLKLKFCHYQNGRDNCFYLKSGRRIIKLLNLLGLFDKSLELSDLTATRSLLSMVNRQVNFETANINRLIGAAEDSIAQIKALLQYPDQEIWTESLRQLSLMRLKYPHDSIEGLGKRFDPPLSKSAVNHRLRRIKSLYLKKFPPAETDQRQEK